VLRFFGVYHFYQETDTRFTDFFLLKLKVAVVREAFDGLKT